MFKRLLPVRYLRKHSVAVVVIVLLILALLRALQGFNMCDDGFNLSGYRLVFSSPGSINYLFLFYWLINVGGLWICCLVNLEFMVFVCWNVSYWQQTLSLYGVWYIRSLSPQL